ncbi:MAG: glycosyltransferase [Rhizobiaceae bacterium]
MHIGFFSSIVTDGHPTSGYELANEAIVEGLRSLGHAVSVIGFRLPRQHEADRVYPIAVTNLENVEASRLKKAVWLLRAHFSGLPVAAGKLTAFGADRLQNLVEKHGPFDAHILNSWQMAAAYPMLLEKSFGFVSHNVEHITAAENSSEAETPLNRYLYAREARLLKAFEERLCATADWVWALSESDLDALPPRRAGGSVLPLVAPEPEGGTNIGEKSIDIGMIGTWTWQANTLGLRWFVDEVLPLLPEDLSISIAGSVPPDIAGANPRIEFVGRVDSASDFLDNVRVIALISRGGTGVQLKTIEAFQAGHTCVATSSSLRGVEMLPANCRTTDQATSFAHELINLVEASKAGTLPKVDGKAFAKQQQEALQNSLNEGLTAIIL